MRGEYLADIVWGLVHDLKDRAVELAFECQDYDNGEEYAGAMIEPLYERIVDILYMLAPPDEAPHPKEAEIRALIAEPLPPPPWIEDDPVVPRAPDCWPDGTPYLPDPIRR